MKRLIIIVAICLMFISCEHTPSTYNSNIGITNDMQNMENRMRRMEMDNRIRDMQNNYNNNNVFNNQPKVW